MQASTFPARLLSSALATLLALATATLLGSGCMTGTRPTDVSPAEQQVIDDTEMACAVVSRHAASSWAAVPFSSNLWRHLAKKAMAGDWSARSRMSELMRSYQDLSPSCSDEVIERVEAGR